MSGVRLIKIFTIVITSAVLAIACHFHPSLTFAGKSTRVETLMALHFNSSLLALLANISLGLKWLTRTKTLAYYKTVVITSVKRLMIPANDPVL